MRAVSAVRRQRVPARHEHLVHLAGVQIAAAKLDWADARAVLDGQVQDDLTGQRHGHPLCPHPQGTRQGQEGQPVPGRRVLGETAERLGRTQTREGARHRRLARRRGTAKACVATGNTQLKVYHKLLSNPGMRYQDLGPDYYERQRDVRRQIAHHVGKLGALGFEVTLCRLPEPDPDGTSPIQVA